jgi:hypothetical protein
MDGDDQDRSWLSADLGRDTADYGSQLAAAPLPAESIPVDRLTVLRSECYLRAPDEITRAAPTDIASGADSGIRRVRLLMYKGEPVYMSDPAPELMTADELGRNISVGLDSEDGRAGVSSLVHMIELRGGG